MAAGAACTGLACVCCAVWLLTGTLCVDALPAPIVADTELLFCPLEEPSTTAFLLSATLEVAPDVGGIAGEFVFAACAGTPITGTAVVASGIVPAVAALDRAESSDFPWAEALSGALAAAFCPDASAGVLAEAAGVAEGSGLFAAAPVPTSFGMAAAMESSAAVTTGRRLDEEDEDGEDVSGVCCAGPVSG